MNPPDAPDTMPADPHRTDRAQPADSTPADSTQPGRRPRTRLRPAPEQRPAPPDESTSDDGTPDSGTSHDGTSHDGTPDDGTSDDGTSDDGSGVGPGADGLTDRERGILAFERQWWKHAGAKEQAIRDSFGLSATRYYQLLNNLLDNPAALAVEPQLVARLRRLRAARARNRRR